MSGITIVLRFWFVIAACATLGAAQVGSGGMRPLTEQDLISLHSAGLSEEELVGVLEKRGSPKLTVDAVERLKSAGLPTGLVEKLAPPPAPRPIKEAPEPVGRAFEHGPAAPAAYQLTMEEVIGLLQAGIPENEVIQTIHDTGSRFDLTLDQTVELVRRGVPSEIVKLMRSRGASTHAIMVKATVVTLDDVGDMAEAGLDASEMLRRIRHADSKFAVKVDDLIQLSRKKVPTEVLKEIWARREPTALDQDPRPTAPANSTTESSATPAADLPPALSTHRETAGGYSITVPAAWFLSRETRGTNVLLSFNPKKDIENALPDAELQIFRTRVDKPENLARLNLRPISRNFLNSLKHSYGVKGMTLTYADPTDTFVSGRPAVIHRVTSSSSDGVNHNGEVICTFSLDQIYVVSYAARAETDPSTVDLLRRCARSFTLEENPTLPVRGGQPEDELKSLFEAWKTAVLKRDFAKYRQLFPTGIDTAETRNQFVSLGERLTDPQVRVALDDAIPGSPESTIAVKILSATRSDSLILKVISVDGRLLLKP